MTKLLIQVNRRKEYWIWKTNWKLITGWDSVEVSYLLQLSYRICLNIKHSVDMRVMFTVASHHISTYASVVVFFTFFEQQQSTCKQWKQPNIISVLHKCGWELAVSWWNGISLFQTVAWLLGQHAEGQWGRGDCCEAICWFSSISAGLLRQKLGWKWKSAFSQIFCSVTKCSFCTWWALMFSVFPLCGR